MRLERVGEGKKTPGSRRKVIDDDVVSVMMSVASWTTKET